MLSIAPTAVADQVVIDVSPLEIMTEIGSDHVLDVTISNTGSGPSGALIAHLVVIDPTGDASADAEDWTQGLSRRIDGLAAGESIDIAWDVKPIMPGDFIALISVASLDPTQAETSTSAAVRLTVSRPALLVSGATVPTAMAIPVVVLLVALWIRRREAGRVAGLADDFPNLNDEPAAA